MLIFGIVANAAVLRPVPYVFSVITKHSTAEPSRAAATVATTAAAAMAIEAANFIINSHAYIDKRCHRVCTQGSPFRQFHSSLSLRTNLTMLHIC